VAPLHYEDFEVGQRFESAARVVSEADIQAFAELSGDRSELHLNSDHARDLGFTDSLAHGPLVVGMVLGLLFEERTLETTAIGMLDLDWRFAAPVVAGDSIRYEMTITRCRRSRTRQAGVVNRHFVVVNQDGSVVQEGTSSVMVRARADAVADDPAVRRDFASPEWARQLLPHLAAGATFAAATSTYDGAIGLQCGRESVQLRVYKGSVIDVARSTPTGPSFTLIGTEMAWLGLALGERNDFVGRASVGEFSTSGSAYEYLRMIKAVVAIWDAIRSLAAFGDAA
jgi:acyl dehydratase